VNTKSSKNVWVAAVLELVKFTLVATKLATGTEIKVAIVVKAAEVMPDPASYNASVLADANVPALPGDARVTVAACAPSPVAASIPMPINFVVSNFITKSKRLMSLARLLEAYDPSLTRGKKIVYKMNFSF
jgi:hypothetical protein